MPESWSGKLLRAWQVACIGCDHEDSGPGSLVSGARFLRRLGWKTRRGLWVCPRCLAPQEGEGEP